MNDETSLLAAIGAAPDDTTLKMAYADWLGETDPLGSALYRIVSEPDNDEWRLEYARLIEPADPHRAEFIRADLRMWELEAELFADGLIPSKVARKKWLRDRLHPVARRTSLMKKYGDRWFGLPENPYNYQVSVKRGFAYSATARIDDCFVWNSLGGSRYEPNETEPLSGLVVYDGKWEATTWFLNVLRKFPTLEEMTLRDKVPFQLDPLGPGGLWWVPSLPGPVADELGDRGHWGHQDESVVRTRSGRAVVRAGRKILKEMSKLKESKEQK